MLEAFTLLAVALLGLHTTYDLNKANKEIKQIKDLAVTRKELDTKLFIIADEITKGIINHINQTGKE